MRTTARKKKMEFEDYAYILDYLEYGYSDDKRPIHQRKPIGQAFGEKQFVLMELVFKDEVSAELAEKVYIGKGKRDKVDHVSRMLKYNELTPTAKTELLYVIKEAVKQDEDRFIKFLNECGPITSRLHSLQLIPGIGKTSMWKIIEEREVKPFESFKDFEERVHKNIIDAIAKRIEGELKEPQKYYLFVKWKEGLHVK
ncbi:MAG: putative nucleotide binding protein [Methanothermococcus sp.]|jgi:putative nucleotide binding protein|uniref:DUF655 domain-containing protein n=1 Tax=Methanothermococcus TaxID=155862 RepID=UPI000378A80F|nr:MULTISPECIES: DUF655 domain-containing protein [Methanothermococcus]MDK2790784.1 putative nucleotide binding protein [Methanothermococcus sp.]MDK2988137.1 putative nucleotide binding protein [Methanothermococcus sp.]